MLKIAGCFGVCEPADPAAGVDRSSSGDTLGRGPIDAGERDGRQPASIEAVVWEEVGCEREVLPGGTHQPLVAGDGGGSSARVCQGEDVDGSLPGVGREVVLSGLDGEGTVGEGLPQDDPGDCVVPDRLASLGVKDNDRLPSLLPAARREGGSMTGGVRQD